MPNSPHNDTSAYFAPLLPWQGQAWTQVTHQFYADKLPHALLASGAVGIGKRAFVWRFVAWLLCENRGEQGACETCASCTWLKAGTHPDLMVLPAGSMLGAEMATDNHIKIDDVRALQDYSHVKGHGVRLIVLDNADTLTLGASNALLKTLEEPRHGVHLLLISDSPSRLLPTIKSRVQALPLAHIDRAVALDYLKAHLSPEYQAHASMLLNLADGAVLFACELPQKPWFAQRGLWVKTLNALRRGTRPPIVACDYWQTLIPLDEFVALSRLMFADVVRVYLGLPSLHDDLNVAELLQDTAPIALDNVEQFVAVLDDVAVSLGQNVQDKLAYEMLMTQMARL